MMSYAFCSFMSIQMNKIDRKGIKTLNAKQQE